MRNPGKSFCAWCQRWIDAAGQPYGKKLPLDTVESHSVCKPCSKRVLGNPIDLTAKRGSPATRKVHPVRAFNLRVVYRFRLGREANEQHFYFDAFKPHVRDATWRLEQALGRGAQLTDGRANFQKDGATTTVVLEWHVNSGRAIGASIMEKRAAPILEELAEEARRAPKYRGVEYTATITAT